MGPNAPRSECPIQRILHMHNIEPPNVLFPMYDNARSTHVTTTCDHDYVSGIKFDKVRDFSLFKVKLDSVVDFNQGIRVPNGAAIMCDNMRDTFRAHYHFTDFEKFVSSFFGGDAVDREAAFNIVKKTEVLARFLDRDNIYAKS